jgi:DNA topoisomerase IA
LRLPARVAARRRTQRPRWRFKHVNPELARLVAAADPRIKSKTWDDSKITAHHGIVPTMHKGSKAGLSEKRAQHL